MYSIACFKVSLSLKEVLWLFLDFFGFLALDLEFWLLLVEFHKLGQIELRLLEELHLSHKGVLEREDFATLLLDLFTNRILNTNIIKY